MRDNATDIPVYGIDKELQAKAAAKYDPTREREAREWIEAVTGEKFRKEGFHESLKDGVLLVKLANRVINSNYKPNVSTMPFKQMENINNFLSALDKLGVPKTDCFQTVDLFENKNPNQVVDTIFAFSRHACKHGFDGPILGPKLADKREVQFSEEQLSQGKNIIGLQMGFTGGANASGVSYGGRRQIMDPKVGSGATDVVSQQTHGLVTRGSSGNLFGGRREIGGSDPGKSSQENLTS